ncbi:uncharacterized protein METZ01_LOCUS82509, partial [marine metagenome]
VVEPKFHLTQKTAMWQVEMIDVG